MSSSIVLTLQRLKKAFPNPGAMELGSPYHTVVAVMLSARTRDEQVLKLLPGFFTAFPTVEDLSQATVRQIEAKVDTIGMYRQKAKNLSALAKKIVTEFDGAVPKTMEELVTLPGVGRKTASVVLVCSFDQAAIAVDTHVFRVTQRLGWIRAKTVEEAEQKLLALVPKRWHQTVNRVFVKLGRYVCIRSPRCWMCPVKDVCAYSAKRLVPPANAEAIRADVVVREAKLESLRERVYDIMG